MERKGRREKRAFTWALEFSFVPKPVPYKDGGKTLKVEHQMLASRLARPVDIRINSVGNIHT